MRWSIVLVIWCRELRDQLRDRRTLFMIAVLPVLLYPLVGLGMMQLTLGYMGRPKVIGIVGSDFLPQPGPLAHPSILTLSWLGLTPGCASVPAMACAAGRNDALAPYLAMPPLVDVVAGVPHFQKQYLGSPAAADPFEIRLVGTSAAARLTSNPREWRQILEQGDPDLARVDLLLVVPPAFTEKLLEGKLLTVHLLPREHDDHSRLVLEEVLPLLSRWKQDLKSVRFLRQGLSAHFDELFSVWDPEHARPVSQQLSEGLFKILTQVFPFVLVMWSLAGALYPAVDLCAGEKERGTMETLLISPASREEIVWGKFLTIWVFSTATALLNLFSMGITIWQFSRYLAHNPFQMDMLFWGIVLLLPLSAFFSAMCLAVGVYARSSKEGQYYLMPLFLITMPLIFLTLAPGVELNPFYSMVPVTGVALLLQALMTSGGPQTSHWLYFVPVLAPMVIYSWLALRWAIEQFHREEVLFREAERLDLSLWMRHLFRAKEPYPSGGQALFCFVLILVLRWLALNVGTGYSLLVRTGISYLAFVAAPPLFMAVILTSHPLIGLGLRLPRLLAVRKPLVSSLGACAFGLWLGILVVPPLSQLILCILMQVPALRTLLEANNPLAEDLKLHLLGPDLGLGYRFRYLLILGLLPAICEELAFRGFILTGLSRQYRPWTAVFLSSFLFALYQTNVFQFAPHFILGLLLGMLALRTGSVIPPMLFHLVYNSFLMSLEIFGKLVGMDAAPNGIGVARDLFLASCSLLTVLLLIGLWRLSGWQIAGTRKEEE